MLETPSNFTIKNPFSTMYKSKADSKLLNNKLVAAEKEASVVRTSKDGVEGFVPLGGMQASSIALWLQSKLN